MRNHHKIAFTQPCFEPEDCVPNAFAKRLPRPNDDVTVNITLNIGLE